MSKTQFRTVMLKLALRANQTTKMENSELNAPVRPLLCSHELGLEDLGFRFCDLGFGFLRDPRM